MVGMNRTSLFIRNLYQLFICAKGRYIECMEYRNLGRSGLKVSEISLGGWVTFGHSVNDQQVVRDIVLKAYEHA